MLKTAGGAVLVFFLAALLAVDSAHGKKCEWEDHGVRPSTTNASNVPMCRFSYIVSLRDKDGRHACGGALMDAEWVLTAAHCVDPDYKGSVGDKPTVAIALYYSNDKEVAKKNDVKVMRIKKTILHPNYDGRNLSKGYDAAMLELLEPVADLPTITPAASNYILHPGHTAFAVGWGTAKDLPRKRPVQAIEHAAFSDTGCSREWNYTVDVENTICAYSQVGEGCKVDPGGPLIVAHAPEKQFNAGIPDLDLLVGIGSFGDENCLNGTKPMVFTPLPTVWDWFRAVIDGEPFEDPAESPQQPPEPSPDIPNEESPQDPEESSIEIPDEDSLKETEEDSPQQPEESSVEIPNEDSPQKQEEDPQKDPEESSMEIPNEDSPQEREESSLGLPDEDSLQDPEEASARLPDEPSGTTADEFNDDDNGINEEMRADPVVEPVADAPGTTSVDLIEIGGGSGDGSSDAPREPMDLSEPSSSVVGDFGEAREELGMEMFDAVEDGAYLHLKAILEEGANPSERNQKGNTPLHLAADNNSLRATRLLIEYGADIHIQGADGYTPLHVASMAGHTDIVKELIDAGADVDARDKDGSTPLDWASDEGYLDVVEDLIDAGANVDSRDNQELTALHWASKAGYLPVVKELLAAGADIDAQTDIGETPLHLAAAEGRRAVVEYLVAEGADKSIKDTEGFSAFQLLPPFLKNVLKLLFGD